MQSDISRINQKGSESIHRDNSLDIVRGVAVILMILAHTIFFFHDGSNTILNTIKDFGNITAFVIFLVVAGATSYYTYQRGKRKKTLNNTKAIKRILFLLFGYYIVAFVSYFKHFDFSSAYWIKQLLEIITFINTPGFTEFLVNFIFYGILFLIIPKIFIYLGNHLKVSVIVGLTIYLLGILLYNTNPVSILIPYKALLFGHGDMFRFPLLQYFIVYLFGFNLGHLLSSPIEIGEKRKFLFLAMIPFTLIIITTLSLNKILPQFSLFNFTNFNRWPPSIPFLSLGVFCTIVLFFVTIKASYRDNIKGISKLFARIGIYAYYYFIFHIIFLQIYHNLGGPYVTSWIYYIVASVILFIITSMTVKFYVRKTVSTIHKKSHTIDNKYKKGPQTLLGRIILPILLVSILIIGNIFRSSIFIKKDSNQIPNNVKGIIFSKKDFKNQWWDLNYKYNKKISFINNRFFSSLNKNNVVEVQLDNNILSKAKFADIEHPNIQIIYKSKNSFMQLKYNLKINDKNTYVIFRIVNSIPPQQKDSSYYIYYGTTKKGNLTLDSRLQHPSSKLISIKFSNEHIAPLTLHIDHKWYLLDVPKRDKLKVTLGINEDIFPKGENIEYTYFILNTNMEGRLYRNRDNDYFSNIDINKLKPGTYEIQGRAKSKGKEIFSSKSTFIVSYPIYVTWTMDWEGYDVKDLYLENIRSLADTYSIPISHFFNPRIYIASDISEKHVKFLTDWVLSRINTAGDSLDMHMHMFDDMVTAAGIDPVHMDNGELRPQWGSIKQGGYDILTTSYNRDELTQILSWGLQMFKNHRLPAPVGYRAGGWFANLENLKAIQDSGFLFDSSGRTAYVWGSKRDAGPWHLTATTQPYYPSIIDQNLATPAPTFNILEIPNNGADSYTFSDTDMINRFDQNYGGGVLKEKKVITYLSHPHWFNIDYGKLEKLFSYISKFDITHDTGPVVYSNIQDVYKVWSK